MNTVGAAYKASGDELKEKQASGVQALQLATSIGSAHKTGMSLLLCQADSSLQTCQRATN
jgi:hypothetical protein